MTNLYQFSCYRKNVLSKISIVGIKTTEIFTNNKNSFGFYEYCAQNSVQLFGLSVLAITGVTCYLMWSKSKSMCQTPTSVPSDPSLSILDDQVKSILIETTTNLNIEKKIVKSLNQSQSIFQQQVRSKFFGAAKELNPENELYEIDDKALSVHPSFESYEEAVCLLLQTPNLALAVNLEKDWLWLKNQPKTCRCWWGKEYPLHAPTTRPWSPQIQIHPSFLKIPKEPSCNEIDVLLFLEPIVKAVPTELIA